MAIASCRLFRRNLSILATRRTTPTLPNALSGAPSGETADRKVFTAYTPVGFAAASVYSRLSCSIGPLCAYPIPDAPCLLVSRPRCGVDGAYRLRWRGAWAPPDQPVCSHETASRMRIRQRGSCWAGARRTWCTQGTEYGPHGFPPRTRLHPRCPSRAPLVDSVCGGIENGRSRRTLDKSRKEVWKAVPDPRAAPDALVAMGFTCAAWRYGAVWACTCTCADARAGRGGKREQRGGDAGGG
ncbi:hypothetical protein DFH07DRAFT_397276 [Mycena maculata]|uniref:Uncharacterized protein n=1 Tax=Mycena maculata TaxID=230809 RepID=A0AAD7H627_9AGAR|nr:hypothetical protein DFH07DRAFT_397276 [Mycena maculata]